MRLSRIILSESEFCVNHTVLVDPHFSKMSFWLDVHVISFANTYHFHLGSIVLKLFLTMKNTIIPIRPAGKCIQIQFIKSDLSWIGFFTKLLSRNGDN